MEDFKSTIEKLILDAADCEMIGNLATDVNKRAVFKRLAERYREMLSDLKKHLPEA